LGWNIFNHELGEFLDNVPPQKTNVDWWYQGTADSIYQNLNILERERPQHVLILSGDHIYKMNYRNLLAFHREKAADLTVACVALSLKECQQMGVIQTDERYRIIGFQEKPTAPKPMPSDPSKALASMGVYVFNTEPLVRELIYDSKRDTQHDFGKNVIPRMIRRHGVFAYNFESENKKKASYWRDVGSIDSYFEANMELIPEDPVFDLHHIEWPIRTYQEQAPPAKICLTKNKTAPPQGGVIHCLVSNGCFINGGTVKRSILSPFVRVSSHALVEDAILMRGVTVGPRARIRRAIIDEGISIPDNYTIGYDLEEDRKNFFVSQSGIVVVPEGCIID
jgi:glucose-1-phosphate adenylyltransferase